MPKKKEKNSRDAIAEGETKPIVPFSEFLAEKEKEVKEWTGNGPRPRHPDFIENQKPSKESLIPSGYKSPSTLTEQMAEQKVKVHIWYFVTREWLPGELIEVFYSVYKPHPFIYAVVKTRSGKLRAYSFDTVVIPEAVQVKVAA